MRSSFFAKRTAFSAALAAMSVLALASTSEAGWRRWSSNCGWSTRMQQFNTVQPISPVQPVAPATAMTPGYQSFSYEPASPAPVVNGVVPVVGAVPLADSNSNARSFYRGDYRVQPNDQAVPNMFRADRKILGLQSN